MKRNILILIVSIFLMMEVNAQQTGTFEDPRDGKVYNTVVIGNQIWMAENLAFKPETGNYWVYDNNQRNLDTYGYLYDWKTANTVCPSGWHLPSDDEWGELTNFLGGNLEAGNKLKETGTRHWERPNAGATNESGFAALPGGWHNPNRGFQYMGDSGRWWTSSVTDHNAEQYWRMGMRYNRKDVNRASNSNAMGFSVRCVKD